MPINFPATPANGDIYTYLSKSWIYNSTTGTWAVVSGQTLDDLSNVVVPTPTNNDLLKYNGTNWINSSAVDGGSA